MHYGNYGVRLLCFLFAYLMYRYKAVWLLSGYNTASKEQRDKYDTNKACKIYLARYVHCWRYPDDIRAFVSDLAL